MGTGQTNLGCQPHASGCEETAAFNACGHHSEFACLNEANQVLDLLLEVGVGEVCGLVGIRWLVGRDTGVAERHFVG